MGAIRFVSIELMFFSLLLFFSGGGRGGFVLPTPSILNQKVFFTYQFGYNTTFSSP